jgi:hypothetical protein
MGASVPMNTAPANGRYSFWIDHNPFATAITKLIAQNVSFSIYSAWDTLFSRPLPGSEVPVWIRIEDSNDCPPEIIQSASEIAAGRTVYLNPASVLPPYYLDTKYTKNASDFNYITDQGRYVVDAYSGSGFGMARTGAHSAIFQSFVPQSPVLTSIYLNRLFRTGSLVDATQYSDITVTLYDSALKPIGVIGKIKKNYPLQYGNNPSVLGVKFKQVTWVTLGDGSKVWTDIDTLQLFPDMPLPVKPGDTYYIGVAPDTFGASFNYSIGSNANTTDGKYNNRGRYIFGQAYAAFKTGSVFTSVTPIGTDLSICFSTQRNIGRTAYTFLWDTPATRYWIPPDQAYGRDQFKFVKENFDQRI